MFTPRPHKSQVCPFQAGNCGIHARLSALTSRSARYKTCLQTPTAKFPQRQTLPASGHCWHSARLRNFMKASKIEVSRRRTSACCSTDCSKGPDLSLLSSALQSQWHHDKNAHLGSILIKPYSEQKVWWTCHQCPDGHPHQWEATVANRSNGTGCPFCASRAVCQHNSLAVKAPDVAAQLSDKNEGTAQDYMVNSTRKLTWLCKHGHEWDARIADRTKKRPSGCPICNNATKRRPHKRQPTLTASQHPIMQLWDWELNAKAGFNPSKITCKSAKRAHWICHQCPKGQPHRWQARVYNVFAGSRCPCCGGQQVCVCNSLQALHPDIAAEWDYTRNKGTPHDYTASSSAQAWWFTSTRGSFKTRIDTRTYEHP